MVFTVPYSYNMLRWITRLWILQAVPSTLHGLPKFPTDKGIAIVQSTTLGPPEQSHTVQHDPEVPIFKEQSSLVDMEEVMMNEMHEDKKIKVGMELQLSLQEGLINLLKKRVDAIAWKPQDMKGIP